MCTSLTRDKETEFKSRVTLCFQKFIEMATVEILTSFVETSIEIEKHKSQKTVL